MPVPDLSTFLTDLGSYLAAASCGTLGTTLFLGKIPLEASLTSAVSMLTETAGPPSNDPQGTAFPRIQVITRCSAYATARTRAHLIYQTLHDLRGEIVGGYSCNVSALQLPFKIGIDERQAHLFSCNYQFDVM